MPPIKPSSSAGRDGPHPEPTLKEVIGALTLPDRIADSNPSNLSGFIPKCVLCLLVKAGVIRGIKSLFAEFVNDPQARIRLRASHGFCARHTDVVIETGDSLGVAILYADLANQAILRLAGQPERRLSPAFRKSPPPCPACVLQAEADRRYAGALGKGLASQETWTALQSGPMLCLNHLRLTLSASDNVNSGRLRQLQTEKLSFLKAELEEIIRKNDYRFRNEAWGDERDAWLRAIKLLESDLKP